MASYYRQRASAGLIITESTKITAEEDGFGSKPGIYNQAQVDGWKAVSDAVHAVGGVIFLQLWHPGRAAHPLPNMNISPVSSCNRPISGKFQTAAGEWDYPTPRALRKEELPGIVRLFSRGAENAFAAGFDGIEIHAAHGYLLDQFLRDGVNNRGDEYGGSIENRARLIFEVMDAVSGVFGADRVGIRISPLVTFNDITDSAPPRLVAHVAQELQKRAAAFLDLRHQHHADPADAELARVARQHYHGCLIRNAGFTRESGEAAIGDGTADAIAYGVPFISNPDLVERFRKSAPLNSADSDKFYSPGPKGYTDYPAMS